MYNRKNVLTPFFVGDNFLDYSRTTTNGHLSTTTMQCKEAMQCKATKAENEEELHFMPAFHCTLQLCTCLKQPRTHGINW